MDYYNLDRLYEMKPKNSRAQVELLGEYNPSGEMIIEDPYFVSKVSYCQYINLILSFLDNEFNIFFRALKFPVFTKFTSNVF